ncbi:nucleoside-diphosphate sugar epimerase [Labilibaculum manganireducens]|uniref:Nucleoside-diphosphate sugar epimerase n=1 Tax=Labilibaculum manganireducens TaxID=1940525 RepID=A0A2N3IBN9_9BACT|nr:NAD(P)H-binding protein [Labilibaculum manganireducens]PKQ67710.1 nucleoside-diphosphate sugar epimerase [Labilibaculum manganireducens]
MGKTAIILGASGLTGKLLLNRLLEDEAYTRVKIFTRRGLDLVHPKLKEFIGDLLSLEEFKKDFTGDEVFCCIGTTAKKTKDKTIYRKIDFGIPATAASLAKANGIKSFLVISALGADAGSNIFYNKTKGEMEQAVLSQEIANTYILRPSLINGKRDEDRLGEKIGSIIMKVLSPFLLGKWKKYRAIEAETIANALHALAQAKPDYKIIESDKIQEIGAYL